VTHEFGAFNVRVQLIEFADHPLHHQRRTAHGRMDLGFTEYNGDIKINASRAAS